MEKTKKLLKVLDLSEEKQVAWLRKEFPKDIHWCAASKEPCFIGKQEITYLAFKLRDKVLESKNGTIKWVAGMFDVYMKMTGSKLFNWKWGYVEAQPIHWIVAASIAKKHNEKIQKK